MNYFAGIWSNGRFYYMPILEVQKLVFKSLGIPVFKGTLSEAIAQEKLMK